MPRAGYWRNGFGKTGRPTVCVAGHISLAALEGALGILFDLASRPEIKCKTFAEYDGVMLYESRSFEEGFHFGYALPARIAKLCPECGGEHEQSGARSDCIQYWKTRALKSEKQTVRRMNINEHPIYKDIYDLCQAIEKLPASEQETKIVVMAGELEKPAAKLLKALRDIKLTALTATDGAKGLAHITRLCIDAGIHQHLDELRST